MKHLQKKAVLILGITTCALLLLFFFHHQIALLGMVCSVLLAILILVQGLLERKRKQEEQNIPISWYTHASFFGALGLGCIAITLLVAQLGIGTLISSFPFTGEVPLWFAQFFRIVLIVIDVCFIASFVSGVYYSLWFQYRLYDWRSLRREKQWRKLCSKQPRPIKNDDQEGR